jgi:DNA-binding MarR family transcriptional regulator
VHQHHRRNPPSLLYAVKQVELAVRSHLDDLLKPAGVTALQFTALTVLERRDDLTAAALARNSFVTTQSMADLVAALHRRGLVERFRDPDDGRRILIHLTDAGRALIAEQRPAVEALEKRMLDGLGASEVEVVRNALNRMRQNLEDD